MYRLPIPFRPFLALAGFLVLASCLLSCRPASAQHVEEIVDAFAEQTDFDGVVLVAGSDTARVARAYGWADIENEVATSMDTRYQLGSISKWVSTLVVLRLADEGALDLDMPIETYLPDVAEETGRRVTLHHLLTHTSGVPNDFVTAYAEDPAMLSEAISQDEAVRRYASGDLLFAPGSRFDYSHSNWILVQAIVERVTGQSFEESIARWVTGPLGLDDTGVFSGAFSSVPRSAVGYESLEPVPVRMSVTLPEYALCMGGIYSTAADLLALMNGVYGGAVLSEDSMDRLTSVVVEEEGYAYGGRVRGMDLGGQTETVVWLTGSNGPFKSRISRVLADGLTIITLSNTGTSPEETGEFSERVLEAVYR